MVPGITERERRAAELQRLTWLAEARLGSAIVGDRPRPDVVSRGLSPLGVWRRALTAACLLGQRLQPRASAPVAAPPAASPSAPR
jgi:hypothetical protein